MNSIVQTITKGLCSISEIDEFKRDAYAVVEESGELGKILLVHENQVTLVNAYYDRVIGCFYKDELIPIDLSPKTILGDTVKYNVELIIRLE